MTLLTEQPSKSSAAAAADAAGNDDDVDGGAQALVEMSLLEELSRAAEGGEGEADGGGEGEGEDLPAEDVEAAFAAAEK